MTLEGAPTTLEEALGPELPGAFHEKVTRSYGSGAGPKAPMRPGQRGRKDERPIAGERHGEARGHGRASDRPEELAAALGQSGVGTLLVEADRRIRGSVAAARRMPSRTGAVAVSRHWTGPGARRPGCARAAAERVSSKYRASMH